MYREDIIQFILDEKIARVSTGIQTFYQPLRELFAQKATLDEVYLTLETLKKNHIIVHGDILYGYPCFPQLGKEEDIVNEAECKTDPDMVAEFVEETGCDTLAVSVGNVHGLCLNPQIDIPLLEKINQVSKVPLVLHGGSGIPKEVIWEAKKHGLIKINYGSDLRKEYIKTFGVAYEANHNEHDVIHLSIEAVEAVSKKAQELVTMINEH